MTIKISGGKVLLPHGLTERTNVYVCDGVISAVTTDALPFDEEIYAEGRYVSPGFVEIHSHGAGGKDFLDGTVDAFLTIAEVHARHGVTTLIPTATSGDFEDTLALDRTLDEANALNRHGADMPGLHLEGPYFADSQRGAQDPRYLRDPKPEEYMRVLDGCRHLMRWSIAPELPGALELGDELHRRGILAAIGHSDAEYPQCDAAWQHGYTHVTHLYSGMSSVHRRNAYRYVGVVEAAYLIDDMTVEIIADGKHLPAELLKLIYRIKGPEHIALITDSMRGAGMPDGPSMLGHWKNGLPVIIEEGVAKLPDRTSFAGSVATFDRLVRNMRDMAEVPLGTVIQMAAKTPAKIMGLHDRGEIAVGKRADLTLFDENIHVSHTMVGGRTVYQEGAL